MFVTCDEDGNDLEKPDILDERYHIQLMDYEESRENVLFEGFEVMQRDENNIILFDSENNIIDFAKESIYFFDEYDCKNIEELIHYSKKEN